MADKIYTDMKCVNPRDVRSIYKELHHRHRARNEKANSRLKNFTVLSHTFRHDIKIHVICSHAVAQLFSQMIKTAEPLFK